MTIETLDRYYLGADPGWLWSPPPALPDNVGLFVTHGRLSRPMPDGQPTKRLWRPARIGWALDSGGYNELVKHRRYRWTPQVYVDAVRQYQHQIGHLEWAASMDWPVGPDALNATGLGAYEHLVRTVDYCRQAVDAWWVAESAVGGSTECPIMPVLQGRNVAEFIRCADLYEAAGLRLGEYAVVGIGSIAAASNSPAGRAMVRALARELATRYPAGLRLHAFGVTTVALEGGWPDVVRTADTHAWSYRARAQRLRCHHPGSTVVWETNCPVYAAEWVRGEHRDAPVVDDDLVLFGRDGVQ